MISAILKDFEFFTNISSEIFVKKSPNKLEFVILLQNFFNEPAELIFETIFIFSFEFKKKNSILQLKDYSFKQYSIY